MDKPILEEKIIKAAESVLKKGHRVELIPVNHGVVVKRVRTETVYQPPKKPQVGA